MKIPAKVHYAIAIMTDIAMQGEGVTITGNDIARRQNISFSFVVQLLNKLKHAGLLESIRGGVSGGYRFKGSPAEVTIKKIVEAIEPSFCICPSINIKTAQPVDDTVRAFWKRVGIDVSKRFALTTIEDLVGQAKELGGENLSCI